MTFLKNLNEKLFLKIHIIKTLNSGGSLWRLKGRIRRHVLT